MTQTRTRHPATPRQAAACCRPVDGALDAGLFKALADPTRLAIFACLIKCGRACAVGEIAECCAVDLSVVSRHLAQLARAGLLVAEKRGRTVLYRVDYRLFTGWLRSLAGAVEACCPGRRRIAGAARGRRTTGRKESNHARR